MLLNLKKLRIEKGLSQKGLGEVLQVSQQSINKYENHNVIPDIETLIAMSNYFETSIDYIVGNTKIRNRIEPVSKYDLNNEEKEIIDIYRLMSRKDKQNFKTIIKTFNNK